MGTARWANLLCFAGLSRASCCAIPSTSPGTIISTSAASVGRYRISADTQTQHSEPTSEPTHTAPRGRTAAAEDVRTQCFGWEGLAGLYLMCYAGAS